MDIVDEKLNPTGQVFSVLGYIANNPIELLGTTIHLSSDDFVSSFHQVVFNAINNIAIDSKSQIEDITPLAVDVYLKPYAKYYSIWQSNDGVQFLSDAKRSQGQFSFEHDYNLLKKFSTLRKYYNQGIDIRDIFDYEVSDLNKINKFNENIEKMEVSDIVDHYTNKVINIRDEINEDDDSIVKFSADDDIDTLLARLNEEPVMGYPFVNGYYNTLFRGMQGGRFMLRSASSGFGKSVSLDTVVPMADGTKKLAKDVEVGDKLISRKGQPTTVLAKYPQPKHMLYKVTSYDGREQILHPNHLMSVWSQGQKSYRKYNPEYLLTRPLENIMKDYKSISKDGDNVHKYLLPLTQPVQYKEQQHVIPPYALGVLLGDGSLNEVNKGKLVASFNEQDVLNKFMNVIGSTEYKHGDYDFNYRFTQENNPMVGDYIKEIKRLGLNHTTISKYIPDEYLYDSIENRMELLRGLIDTDGYVGFTKGRNGYNISFSTISEKLKDSFLTLVDGLGIGRYLSNDNRVERYSTGEMFRIALFTDKKIWSSDKHEKQTGGHKWVSNKHLGMPIINIEEYKEEESVCFTVDNDEHLFLINDYIVTHNTRTAIREMANASFTERYEMGKGWVNTGNSVPTLFISTELNKNELQTILLAYISGLTTSDIESGNYTTFEKQRLQHAVEVIRNSKMFFVYVEDFSAVDIQMIIEEYVVRHNVKFVVFDYIQNSPKLTKTFQESYNNRGLREDEILVELSRSLKNMSEKYNIFIMSSTQLNSMADDDNIRVSRTGRALRGGAATINKADYGIIMAKPTASDMKKLQNIIKEDGFGADPNFAHFIFKNRSGKSDIIIWTNYDMGNMRETPLFITDFNYNLVSDVNPSFIKEKNTNTTTKQEDIKF